jgi:cytidylate kinase
MQRDMALKHNVVMDGRDIGTVVLPEARVKIFLTAAPEERARRRYEELRKKGTPQDFDEVLSEMIMRDSNDSSRAVAPLKPAEDAVIIDSTGLDINEVVILIAGLINERQGEE